MEFYKVREKSGKEKKDKKEGKKDQRRWKTGIKKEEKLLKWSEKKT